MSRLLLFNCSNDLALASNTKEYIAPKSIATMENDLATLPAWWAQDGDAVLLNNKEQAERAKVFFKQKGLNIHFTYNDEGFHGLTKKTNKIFTPHPWGWSKATVERYKQFGVPIELLPDEKQLTDIRKLSSREFAAHYIAELLSAPSFKEYENVLIGKDMRFIHTIEELTTPCRTIFKSPWSSSGRGIFAANNIDEPSIREKLTGFIKRQGGFIADKLYDKEMDFALEFTINKTGVTEFIGYSVFKAGTNGYYGYNIVAPQSELRKMIIKNGCNATLLDKLIVYHCNMLSKKLSGIYSGVVGIDMITANENDKIKIHPCIEINLRMNIGTLAIHINDKRVGENYDLTPQNPLGGFRAAIDKGRLIIAYNNCTIR